MTSLKLLASVVATVTLAGMTEAQVFAPGDPVIGGQSDGTNFNVGMAGLLGGANNWPFGETPANAIDGVGQKYLNFAVTNTGLIVTPGMGSSVAENITFWTANDAVERDPASYELWGTNLAINGPGPFPLANFTLIDSGPLELPDTRSMAGAEPLDDLNSYSVGFNNSVAYTTYMVIFPDVKNSAVANSMQIAEVQLNVGPTKENSMTLQVNTATGVAQIENGVDSVLMDINSYQIESPAGSLDTSGWFSFQDNPLFPAVTSPGAGDGWEEGGGSFSGRMTEAYLLGSSPIAVNQAISLGAIYDRGVGAEDLTFKFTKSDGTRVNGLVQYFSSGPTCDFDGSGSCDVTDLDALIMEISAGGSDPQFDLTGDGNVDLADRDAWLAEAATQNGLASPYKLGDANLDGVVEVPDFNIWNTAKFTTTGKWSLADFNADGFTDVGDFNAWNANKFTSSNPVAVPEPEAWGIAVLGIVGGLSRLVRRQLVLCHANKLGLRTLATVFGG